MYYPYSENKGADQLRVTAKLICVFVFAYAKCLFSHDAAQIILFLMEIVSEILVTDPLNIAVFEASSRCVFQTRFIGAVSDLIKVKYVHRAHDDIGNIHAKQKYISSETENK